MNVSLIGLGVMGAEMARTLLRSGHRVTVWNRTAAKAEPLVRAGAVSCARSCGRHPRQRHPPRLHLRLRLDPRPAGTQGRRVGAARQGHGPTHHRHAPGCTTRRRLGATSASTISTAPSWPPPARSDARIPRSSPPAPRQRSARANPSSAPSPAISSMSATRSEPPPPSIWPSSPIGSPPASA